VPSKSLQRWLKTRLAELDEVEEVHVKVGGTGRGRRYATQQVNQAYVMLLSSHFQGFCRDLHSEAVDHLVNAAKPDGLGPVLRLNLLQGRKLDKGNANPGNIGNDFNRLNVEFWRRVRAHDQRNAERQDKLEILVNGWRNAIAHQDFGNVEGSLTLQKVRSWRKACEALARSFDHVVREHVTNVVGNAPW
jgi:hypothetical protein